MSSLKDMPHDATCEAQALGCVLFRDLSAQMLLDRVNIEDFYVRDHKIIFNCIKEMVALGFGVDENLVIEALKDRHQLQLIGGTPGVYRLNDHCPLTTQFDYYLKRILTKSTARKMITATREILMLARTADVDPVSFVSMARDKVMTIGGDDATEIEAVNIKTIVDEVMQDVVGNRQPAGLVKTCFAGIDARSGGLWPGLLTVVAARPGMGKSCFVQNVGANIASDGKKVLFVTLEDIPYFVGVRHLARFSGVDNTVLSMRSASTDEIERVRIAVSNHTAQNLWVMGASGVSSAALRAAVLRHRDKHGIDLLIVDHLAEVREEAENETQAVSKAARAARDLALELEVPALYAHQLNRKVEDRTDKRPTLSDLKQSGKIEEVARSVWFLYRDGYYTKDDDRHDAQLIISKANHGRTGVVRLWADLSQMYFRDWDDMKDGRFPKQPGVAADGVESVVATRARKSSSKTAGINWMGDEKVKPYLDYNEVVDSRNDFD